MKMKVVSDTPNLLRLALIGSYDPNSDEPWGDHLMSLASNMGQDVILDISAVPHIVSLDFGKLLNAARLVERKCSRFVLLKPQPAVAVVIDTLGMSQLLGVAKDDHEADLILSGQPLGDSTEA